MSRRLLCSGIVLALLVCAWAQAVAPQSELSSLLTEVMRNQKRMNAKLGEYTSQFTSTRRTYDKQGKLKDESVTSGESYQSYQRNVEIDLGRDGKPLSEKKVAQERERAIKALTKDAEDRQNKSFHANVEGPEYGSDFNGARFSNFDVIRYCETYNLRQAEWQGRQMLLVDFRPHPKFIPPDKTLTVLKHLSGSLWIDAADRVIVKTTARVADRVDESAIAYHEELTRMPDGIWVHRYMRFNCASNPQIFNGRAQEWIYERSRHQKFTAENGSENLETPKVKPN